MAVQSRLLSYQHGDTVLEGFLAWDDKFPYPRPAVAISHTWSGRSEFECDKAWRLAELGYVGFAIDVFGKGVRGKSVDECHALISPLMENRALLQERMNLAVDVLRQQPEAEASKIAAMGFCFGGLCALDLARSGSNVRGVISFHGLMTPPDNTAGNKISAKVLCLHGYDDPMAPPEQLMAAAKEFTEAGADWQVHAYGNTMHAFTNPNANDRDFGTVYNSLADKRSWQSMQNFLAEILG